MGLSCLLPEGKMLRVILPTAPSSLTPSLVFKAVAGRQNVGGLLCAGSKLACWAGTG